MNTPSNKVKAQFFALYLCQNIFRYNEYNERIYELVGGHLDGYLRDPFILLRSVDQLSDEEYIEVGKIFYRNTFSDIHPSNLKRFGKDLVGIFTEKRHHNLSFPDKTVTTFNYLRSIGILLPFTYLSEDNKPITLSPSDLIGFGWVKIEKEV